MATRDFNFSVGPETDTLPTASTPSVDDDLMTKGFADNNYVQGGAGVADNAALKAVVAGDRKDLDLRFVDSTQTLYKFDSGSAAADDGVNVLAPDVGSGRWLKIVTANTNAQNFTDTTQSTTKDTGAVVVEGGVGIEKNLNVGGNATVTGNFTVNGTSTTVNTATLDVEDANITVNKGGDQASANAADSGLTVEMSDATNALIGYDSTTTSKFIAGEVGSLIEITTISAAQVITNKDIDGATAADTRRITLPKNITANLNGLTRKEGTVVFDSITKEFKGDNGTVLSAFATAAIATSDATGTITSFVPVIKSSFKDIADAVYTILDDDGFKFFTSETVLTGNITITLPLLANNKGRVVSFKRQDTADFTLSIQGDSGTETIDGATTINLEKSKDSFILEAGVTEWHVISNSPIITGTFSMAFTTPTTNFTSASTETARFARCGKVVQVYGLTTLIVPTPGSLTQFSSDISGFTNAISRSSNFGAGADATGNGGNDGGDGCRIRATAATTKIQFLTTQTAAASTFGFSFMYDVV